MTQHPEIIAAPFTIWIAPLGTAFPTVDAEPGEDWALLGKHGSRSATSEGVMFVHDRQWVTSTPAAETGESIAFIERESLKLQLSVFDLTLEQFRVVLGQNAIIETAAGVLTPGTASIGLALKNGAAAEFAVMMCGPSPYDETMNAQYELPRCCETGSPRVRYTKGRASELTVELRVLIDPAATSAETRFGRLLAASAEALPLPPLKFAGTGLRMPFTSATRSAGDRFIACDVAIGMPDIAGTIDEVWFFLPTFVTPTSGEIDTAGWTVEGIGTRAAGGQRTPGLMNDGTAPVVIPAGSATSPGAWIKFTPAAPIAPNQMQIFSFAYATADGAEIPVGRANFTAQASIFGGMMLSERAQGSSSSMLSTLSTSADYSNVGGSAPRPSHMLVRMTEPSVVYVGDSITAGADQGVLLTDRHTFGFVEMGLDDNTETHRIAPGCFAVSGWGFIDTVTSNSHANTTAAARQLKIVEMARAINNGLPLCDHLFSAHGTNSSTAPIADLRRSIRTLHTLWRNALGCSQSSQSEMLALPGSTDGYATLGNQTPAGGAQDFPSGQRWVLNADIGGPDGLGDAAAALRADGTIVDSLAPWRITSADTGSQRDILSVRAFNTTLSATRAANSPTFQTAAAPPLGAYLALAGGASYCVVTGVSGTGPFTVTGLFTIGAGTSNASGAAVRDTWHGEGLHPGPLAHRAYAFDEAAGFIQWKLRRGWIRPNVAPTITGAVVTGVPEDGATLTVSATVDGFPTPTVTRQWRRNGAAISGQTGASITLNGTAMGLVNGDIITCLVTATNSVGTATATPAGSPAYVASGAVSSFLALIAGSSNSGFFDFTDATTASTFTGPDANGGNAFVARASFQAPGISTSLGALFNASGLAVDRVVTAGAYDIVMVFVRDAATSAAIILDTGGIYDTSGTAASPTTRVNGSSVATRNDFLTALTDGVERTIEFENFTPASTTLSIGDDSFTPRGSFRRVAVIRRADFPSTLAAVRAAAIAAVEAT